ncbi:hypothetical protein ABBQ32_009161 [Trebouxia sp. C0010 RCD-2024]
MSHQLQGRAGAPLHSQIISNESHPCRYMAYRLGTGATSLVQGRWFVQVMACNWSAGAHTQQREHPWQCNLCQHQIHLPKQCNSAGAEATVADSLAVAPVA